MKFTIRALAMILVLLMTLTVVACNNNGDKDDPKETERETERETEQETAPDLTDEEIEQLKMDMTASILEELAKHEQTTTESNGGGSTNNPGKDEDTTNYTDYIEGLLGSLGGLGGDYDYSKVIGEVLDQYIGSNSTSEFIMGLIKSWMENQMNSGEQATKEPTETDSENSTTPPGAGDTLQEFVAQQTAKAISDAIADRLAEVVDGTLREAIYDSVYESMTQDNGFMESILGGLIQ